MPKGTNPKRDRSSNSSKSNSSGHRNKRHAIPQGSTLDAVGNLMPPPQPPRRSTSVSSMTSIRSNSSDFSQSGFYNKNIQKTSSAKPKPIIVEAGLIALNSFLTPLILSKKPLMKVMGTNKTQILSENNDDKAKIITKLKEQQFAFFTYSEPTQKPLIFVLKKYFAAEQEELLATLKAENVAAEKVTVLCPKPEFPSFLVHFSPQATNLLTLERTVKSVGNVIVKWQRFDRSRKRLTQCHNCQNYGHATSNCGKKHRCVKCLEDC